MKLVNTRLQSQMERISKESSPEYFMDYIRSILQDTTKPYHQRADFVGLSILEIQTKIETLSKDIQELQSLKKRLSEAFELSKEIIASIFESNGIDRIDGNIISSLTLAPQTSKTKLSLKILDEKAVMGLGYIKYEPDIAAIELAMMSIEGMEELDQYVAIESKIITTPAKIKVNVKRTTVTQADELVSLVENQKAA
ncbi:MAG: siphovirus Gp157 family protein [Thiovulaceae bacterium]|nr:siphovirus Gp157 family protein [Sulfurimonadaceae bacterium]